MRNPVWEMFFRYAFFWDITQRRVVIFTDVSGQPIGPIFKDQEIQEEKKDFLTLEDGNDCPETSVKNYHSTLRNIPEERSISGIYVLGNLFCKQEAR